MRQSRILLVLGTSLSFASAWFAASCVGDAPVIAPTDATPANDTFIPSDSSPQPDTGGGSDAADSAIMPDSALPIQPMIALGDAFSCALRPSGRVYCWGDNSCGQFGTGAVGGTYFTPAQVSTLTSVAQIATGREAACALQTDGTVWCWGENGFQQLGHANTGDLTSSFCAGGNRKYQPNPTPVAGLSGVVEISSGASHMCARKGDGSVWCWGSNESDQLGYDNTNDAVCVGSTPCNPKPTKVNGIVADQLVAAGGGSFTCARTGTTASCWGDNYYDELGHAGGTNGDVTGPKNPVPKPTAATGIGLLTIGAYNGCMIASKTLSCWGANSGGLLGYSDPNDASSSQSTPNPVAVSLPASVTSAAMGYTHACAVWGGSVSCWGGQTWGEVGPFDASSGYTPPSQLTSLSGISQVAAGYGHTCALNGAGSVFCWGDNTNSALGHDPAGDKSCGNGCKANPTPTQVSSLP